MRIDLKGGGGPSIPAIDQLHSELEKQQPWSIDEANAIAAAFSNRYNRTVQSDLGGLSPEQVHILIQPGWMDEALTLNDRLPAEDLAGAPLLQNARRLLLAVKETGVAKATATGAFNRKLATRMFEEFALPQDEREMVRRLNKVLNQNDVPFMELFRYLLPQAGLLSFRKGEFRLTKRASGLINDSAIGELYAALFRTFYVRFNLGALDGLPDAASLQNTIGFSIYQIGKLTEDWTELGGIAPNLFVPAVLDSLPSRSWIVAPTDYAYLRILRPLKHFGLVEYDQEHEWRQPVRVKKTDLFDQFIQFNLPPAL